MLLSVIGRAFADDMARIADRLRRAQHFEIAQAKIAKRVEVVHLPAHEEEGVLGPVGGRRRAHDHSGGVAALAIDAVGRARRPAKRAEVSKLITQLRFRWGKSEKQSEERRETDRVFCFHRGNANRELGPSV